MKKCPTKELYYLKKSPSATYGICVDSDVCKMVEGSPLDDTWRLSGKKLLDFTRISCQEEKVIPENSFFHVLDSCDKEIYKSMF